jgi:hypothetical protein
VPDPLKDTEQKASRLSQLATHIADQTMGNNAGCVLMIEVTADGFVIKGYGVQKHSDERRNAIVIARAIAFLEREAMGCASHCPNSVLWMKTFESELIRARAMPNRMVDVMHTPPTPPQGD